MGSSKEEVFLMKLKEEESQESHDPPNQTHIPMPSKIAQLNSTEPSQDELNTMAFLDLCNQFTATVTTQYHNKLFPLSLSLSIVSLIRIFSFHNKKISDIKKRILREN